MKKEIKLIIFDLDGTLYNLNDVVAANYQMQLDFFMEYTKKDLNEAVLAFEENNIFPEKRKESRSATEYFARLGLPIKKWNQYREVCFNAEYINKEHAVKQSTLELFLKIAPLVLLSSNSYSNIHKILSHIDISELIFEEIICSDNCHCGEPFMKINEIRALAERREIDPKQIFSVGDRYNTDIKPLVDLGGSGEVVNGPGDLFRVYNLIN